MIIGAIVITDLVNSIYLPPLDELVLDEIRLHMRHDDLLDIAADEGPEGLRIGLHDRMRVLFVSSIMARRASVRRLDELIVSMSD